MNRKIYFAYGGGGVVYRVATRERDEPGRAGKIERVFTVAGSKTGWEVSRGVDARVARTAEEKAMCRSSSTAGWIRRH